MPAISMFYGIIIRMQSEKGGKHKMTYNKLRKFNSKR